MYINGASILRWNRHFRSGSIPAPTALGRPIIEHQFALYAGDLQSEWKSQENRRKVLPSPFIKEIDAKLREEAVMMLVMMLRARGPVQRQ
ncbi:unnamed protein product [Lactuca virosa]|uniref:Uncharacterized protein n=1 Tax=Lactuca virosa TaxID=75947 RepID=A0AAU9N023_9ASTR|nr:unnamed protein product [Lactuca virosa]